MKLIAVHVDRCNGCRTCELYCAVERGSNTKRLLEAVQENPLPKPRIHVEGRGRLSLPLQCRHCVEAPCVDACVSGALVRDPERDAVILREEYCIGCWTCTAFCIYGVIFSWPERKRALKCDRCIYMESPVCVEVCPTKALELVDIEDTDDLFSAFFGLVDWAECSPGNQYGRDTFKDEGSNRQVSASPGRRQAD